MVHGCWCWVASLGVVVLHVAEFLCMFLIKLVVIMSHEKMFVMNHSHPTPKIALRLAASCRSKLLSGAFVDGRVFAPDKSDMVATSLTTNQLLCDSVLITEVHPSDLLHTLLPDYESEGCGFGGQLQEQTGVWSVRRRTRVCARCGRYSGYQFDIQPTFV